MVLNIHPIFVHFPIALLTIYSLLEFVWSRKLKQSDSFFLIKASFLILGVLGAFAALQTGEIAEEGMTDSATRHLISVHSTWAAGATWIFGILALAYIILAYARFADKIPQIAGLSLLVRTAKILVETPLIYLLAILGLIAITVTGALGGAIVYGSDIDPIVSYVYKILIG